VNNMIHVECPGCALIFNASIEMIGDVGSCASCGHEVPVVPMPERQISYKGRGIFGWFLERIGLWRAQN